MKKNTEKKKEEEKVKNKLQRMELTKCEYK